MHDEVDIKRAVRDRYASHAANGTSCCGSAAAVPSACCGGPAATPSMSEQLGYDATDLGAIPAGADLGLGCGNPLAMLELQAGETVVDLGSGGGIDCFLAAKRVGPTGHVIGVDMTTEMLERARRNAREGGFGNVEFRLGEIEHLPVANDTADAIISNCVINLVPDKQQAFREAFRVLRPGGRLSVSDIVLLGEVPIEIRDSVDAYVACLSGAITRDEYLAMIEAAGFEGVEVTEERHFALEDALAAEVVAEFERHSRFDRSALEEAASRFASVRVRALKPAS